MFELKRTYEMYLNGGDAGDPADCTTCTCVARRSFIRRQAERATATVLQTADDNIVEQIMGWYTDA